MSTTLRPAPLTGEELRLLDAYWRRAFTRATGDDPVEIREWVWPY